MSIGVYRREARVRRYLDVLGAAVGPALPGPAACHGLAPAFDADVPGETAGDRDARLAAAARVCGSCPVRDACAAAADQLDPAPRGCWAGHVRLPRPPGRPRVAP